MVAQLSWRMFVTAALWHIAGRHGVRCLPFLDSAADGQAGRQPWPLRTAPDPPTHAACVAAAGTTTQPCASHLRSTGGR